MEPEFRKKEAAKIKVSLITVSYNSQATIADTIDSVLSQDYPAIEYIIIDGKSTDATNEIIKAYGDQIALHISAQDTGIYNAMNKGIAVATGDIIGFINSDDVYENNSVITQIVCSFEKNNVEGVYTDLVYVSWQNTRKITRYWRCGQFNPGMFARGIFPPHPAFFVKRSVYKSYGTFNENYKIAADFDLMLRLLEVHKISNVYLPIVSVKMRAGGASNAGVKQIVKGLSESVHSFKSNAISGRFLFIPKTLIIRFFQQFVGNN